LTLKHEAGEAAHAVCAFNEQNSFSWGRGLDWLQHFLSRYGRGCGTGKKDPELCANPSLGREFDPARVLPYRAVDAGQTKSGSFASITRGKEGLKNS